MISTSTGKRKDRQSITIETKIEIINKKENEHKSDTELARSYNLDRSTVSNIIRNKQKILDAFKQTGARASKRTRMQKGHFDIVEKAVYRWFSMLRSNNIPVSQDILKQKAQEYHQQFVNAGVDLPANFEAANGWLRRFQERFGIVQRTISGESSSVNVSVVENGRQQLQELLEQYSLENIYNADETGLFFRLGPDKTLASKSDTAKGCKRDKQQLTILFACNATGSCKLKPLVIGKSKRPRCLTNVNLNTLPVQYSSNTKALMTGEKWKDWLKWFDQQCTEPTLLLADNCPAHVDFI